MLRRVPCTPSFQPDNILLWDSAFIAGSSESNENTSSQYGNENRKKTFPWMNHSASTDRTVSS